MLLDVEELTVGFESSGGDADAPPVVALSRVSFQVAPGEIMGLVGESGCGKSLTGLAIMGLLPRSARILGGSVRLEERDLLRLDTRTRRSMRGRRMAMVFQEPMVALNPLMRVGRQIEEVLTIHGIGNRRERRARAVALLADVGIPGPAVRARQFPHELSGGMRQRVMVAMALAAEPALIVADEPTTALDVTVQAQVLELLHAIRERRGTAVLLVTHDIGVVAEVADRVTVMYGGHTVEVGSVEEIFHHPRHPYTQGLLDSVPGRAGVVDRDGDLPTIPGRVPEPGARLPGCPFAPRCSRAIDQCTAERPPLIEHRPAHLAACWRPLGDAPGLLPGTCEVGEP